MISNTLIFLSAGVFTLAMLEILLSDAQKTYISSRITDFWNIIDEIKRGTPVTEFFARPSVQKLLVLIFSLPMIIMALLTMFVVGAYIVFHSAIIIWLVLLLWRGDRVIAFAVSRRPGMHIAIRMAIVLIGVIILPGILLMPSIGILKLGIYIGFISEKK